MRPLTVLPTGFVVRLMAAWIDIVLLVTVQLLVLWNEAAYRALEPVRLHAAWIEPIVLLFYDLAWWRLAGGTPGKLFFGLRIVFEDTTTRPPLVTLFVRRLAYFLSGLVCGLGFLAIAWNNRRQGWHDRIAGTQVVTVKARSVWWLKWVMLAGIALGVPLAWYVWGQDAMRSAMRRHEEGARFGAQRTTAGCLHEWSRRRRGCDGVACTAASWAFAEGCFAAAERSKELCTVAVKSVGVPREFRATHCQDVGAHSCDLVFQAMTRSCLSDRTGKPLRVDGPVASIGSSPVPSFPSAVTSGEPRTAFVKPVPLGSLAWHVGQRLEFRKKNGATFQARVVSVRGMAVQVEREIGGGTARYDVSIAELESAMAE